ncbi:MAG TPA: PRC-barrel domain-containing protein [Alphaproteobacteria bacterium]|nr:PRC-barrel domain-containing protein [Alphaproteobacteria bacterium]
MITRLLASTALALALTVPALAQTSTTTTTDTTDTQAQSTEAQGSTEMQTDVSGSEATGDAATGSMTEQPAGSADTAAGGTATGGATTQTGETDTGSSADTSTATTDETAEDAAESSTTATGEASTDTTTDAATGTSGEAILTQQQPGQVRADTLIGAKVTNTEGENVGDVSDILIDEEGSVAGVLLSVGGFLGIGDKKVAVNWDEIQLQEDGEQVVVNMSKDQISEAPAFETMEEQQREQQAEGDVPPAGSTTGTATDATGADATQ